MNHALNAESGSRFIQRFKRRRRASAAMREYANVIASPIWPAMYLRDPEGTQAELDAEGRRVADRHAVTYTGRDFR